MFSNVLNGWLGKSDILSWCLWNQREMCLVVGMSTFSYSAYFEAPITTFSTMSNPRTLPIQLGSIWWISFQIKSKCRKQILFVPSPKHTIFDDKTINSKSTYSLVLELLNLGDEGLKSWANIDKKSFRCSLSIRECVKIYSSLTTKQTICWSRHSECSKSKWTLDSYCFVNCCFQDQELAVTLDENGL